MRRPINHDREMNRRTVRRHTPGLRPFLRALKWPKGKAELPRSQKHSCLHHALLRIGWFACELMKEGVPYCAVSIPAAKGFYALEGGFA